MQFILSLFLIWHSNFYSVNFKICGIVKLCVYLDFRFTCILLQITLKKMFFINIFIPGRSGVNAEKSVSILHILHHSTTLK